MNNLMCWLIPSKESYAVVGTLFMIGGWLGLGDNNLWLGGIICWCAAGIMAHD